MEADVATDEGGAAESGGQMSGFTVQLTKSKDDVGAEMVRAYRACCEQRYEAEDSTLQQFANATERGRARVGGQNKDYSGQNQLHIQAFEVHTLPGAKVSAGVIKGEIRGMVIDSLGDDDAFKGHKLIVAPFERGQTVDNNDHGGMLGYVQKDGQLGRLSHYTFQCGGVTKAQAEAARRNRERFMCDPGKGRRLLKAHQLMSEATKYLNTELPSLAPYARIGDVCYDMFNTSYLPHPQVLFF